MEKTACPAFPMSNMDELTMLFVLAEEIHNWTLPISVFHQAVAQLQDEIDGEARELEVLQSLWRSENTITPYFGGFERIVTSQATAGIHLFRLSSGAPECYTIDPEWVARYLEMYERDPGRSTEQKRILEPLARRLAAIIKELAQKGDQ